MITAPPSSARLHLALGFSALIVLLVGFGSWASLTSISGAVIAPGSIQAVLANQVIQHSSGGIVSKIRVRNGDIVEAGDVMLVLDGTLSRAELSTTNLRQAELLARGARLEAEAVGASDIAFPETLTLDHDTSVAQMIAGQQEIFEARRASRAKEAESLEQRKLQIQAQIEGAIAERSSAYTQIEIISGEVRDQESLFEKGLAQASRLNTLRRQKAALEGSLGRLNSQIGESRERIAELETEFVRKDLNLREENAVELREVRSEILSLREREIALQDNLDRLDIRAPISGMVHGFSVQALQSVISPADQLAQIIPLGQEVVISTRAQPINIDEIHIDQDASLRFSALNQRVTPVLTGKVTRISADVFSDPNTGASFYQVEITPLQGELSKLGEMTLMPGMPVEGYISTASRTPLSYLMKPFMDYFSQAMRES
jgi:HlyD family secretion protein